MTSIEAINAKLTSSVSPMLMGWLFPEVCKLSAKVGKPLTIEDLCAHFVVAQAPSTNVTLELKGSEVKSANPVKGCQYKMSRGARKGEPCGATVKPGEMLCTTCKKKKGDKSEKVVAEMKQAQDATKPVAVSAFAPAKEARKVDAERWLGKDAMFTGDLFWLMDTKFLIRTFPSANSADLEMMVIGKSEDNTEKSRRVGIVDADMALISEMGIQVDPKAHLPSEK